MSVGIQAKYSLMVLGLKSKKKKNLFQHLESRGTLKTLDFSFFDPMKWSETCRTVL